MAQTKKPTTTQTPEEALQPVAFEGMLIESDKGLTRISENVVAKIAGLAVREVDGVRELVPFGAGQTISSIANQIRGGDMKDLGVHVEVGKVEVAVDVRIISDYGTSIPKISDAIRENLDERIKTMTGLRLKEVNIEVVDLYFPEEHVPVEAPAALPSSRVQ